MLKLEQKKLVILLTFPLVMISFHGCKSGDSSRTVSSNFEINTDSNSTRTVSIFDVLGKQVLNTKTSNNAVNVSNLKGGAYIVKITEEGKTDTRKLIIE